MTVATKEYEKYPKVEMNKGNDIMMWAIEWEGGYPNTGCVHHKGVYMYFHLCDDNPSKEGGWRKRYTIHQLSDAHARDMRRWNDEFNRYVGSHMNYTYDSHGKRRRQAEGYINNPVNHEKYYAMYAAREPKVDYKKEGKIVGWFELI